MISIGKKQFIKNMNSPVCMNCIYYILNKSKYGKCSKFGEKDIITGKITYENVTEIRLDENMCGIKGNYHENKMSIE